MQFNSPEEFHNKLGFIFHAMLALPLGGFIYFFLEIKNNKMSAALENGQDMQLLIAGLSFLAIAMVSYGYITFRNKKKEIAAQDSLKLKLEEYLRNIIKFYILVEIASILLVIGLYLTTSTVFIVIFMFVLLVLSLNRPTPQKYCTDLGLTGREQEIILKNKTYKFSQEDQ